MKHEICDNSINRNWLEIRTRRSKYRGRTIFIYIFYGNIKYFLATVSSLMYTKLRRLFGSTQRAAFPARSPWARYVSTRAGRKQRAASVVSFFAMRRAVTDAERDRSSRMLEYRSVRSTPANSRKPNDSSSRNTHFALVAELLTRPKATKNENYEVSRHLLITFRSG